MTCEPRHDKSALSICGNKNADQLHSATEQLLSFPCIHKAVVAGPAGPASAGPLFWPNMLSAVSLFAFQPLLSCYMCYICVVGEELNSSSHNKVLFCSVLLLTCDLIPSNHQKCPVLLIRLSLTHVVARVIKRHSQGVKTIRPRVTRRAKQCNYYNDTCLIQVVIVKGLF